MNKKESSSHGFIALISVIIISSILALNILIMTKYSFLRRTDVLLSEYKEKSFNIALSCIEHVRIKFSQDQTYSGNESLIFYNDTCTIDPIPPSRGLITITVHSQFQNSFTDLKANLDISSLSISSVHEILSSQV